MITEDQLEQQCRGWFREGGWQTVFDPDIAHDGTTPERHVQGKPTIDTPWNT